MRLFRKGEDLEEVAADVVELREGVIQARMPGAVEKIALKEVEKIAKTSPSSAEYTIGMNYIDYLISLPWNRTTEDNLDIARAEAILGQEHLGLREIKDRILEHLAVRILKLSRRHRILVVDDEEMTLKNLDHVLKKEGYDVTTASNGMQALDLINQIDFDLIITDLKMQKVDGMQVLKRAKEQKQGLEVIMITGYATVPSAVEAMKTGSYHYISKPFKLEEIRSTVAAALAPKKAAIETRGPVLCFAGPPGTGKTSLGMSIARSLERKFIRISLAGIRDEAEIRGHRRSYVGALPGRIIQEVRRAESRNPVFMLDELDKIGREYKGDPASSLLEVLDPEQNTHFMDHYLDVPFDLSQVLFIATANTVDSIPRPLLDRLETLRLSGYTEWEKLQIASRYMIPREIKEAGLYRHPLVFTQEALFRIIREYTREAGLRDLQRHIAAICRKRARQALSNPDEDIVFEVTAERVEDFLGPRKYRFEVLDARDRKGVCTGLAWTETGGEIMFIEATMMKGGNHLLLTGSLGEVMKESAQAALSYIRSNTELWGIPDDFFHGYDIHVHVPGAAIPKDGPSAGVPIATALISLLTGRPCRREVALTGELTLSGRILPVGGVREKILAAHRSGVKTAVFPAKNEDDIKRIPEEILRDLEILQIDQLREIIDRVLR